MRTRLTQLTTDYRLLTTVLFLLSCPALAYSFAGGTGQPNDPYQIATAEQLMSIGSDPNLLSKHFVLLNDIDLDPNLPGGRVFDRAVIAPDIDNHREGFQGTPFTGSFDGYDHTISGLYLTSESEFVGLFGYVDGPDTEIKDLQLNSPAVLSDGDCAGALVGCLADGAIVNCCVRNATLAGVRYVGGLVASNSGTVYRCFATCRAKGEWSVGGLAGANGGVISSSFADGSISGGA